MARQNENEGISGLPEMTDDFDTVLVEFRAFIAREGFPTDIVWIFREDVTSRKRRVAIRWPVPTENERVARERYSIGVRGGMGLRMEVFCLLVQKSCCTIWVPRDEIDASFAMLFGLKFSVPTLPIVARLAQRGCLWKAICWWDRRSKMDWVADRLQ